MSSPFEYTSHVDLDLQRPSMPSGPRSNAMAWEWMKQKAFGSPVANRHGRPSDQRVSFDGTQSMSSQDSFHGPIPGTPQSVNANQVHSTVEETNEEPGLVLDRLSGNIDPSTADLDEFPSNSHGISPSQEHLNEVAADSQNFNEGERHMDMQKAAPQNNANYPTYTSGASQPLPPALAHNLTYTMGYGPSMQGQYASLNQGQWDPIYFGQAASMQGSAVGQNPPFSSRYIHDSASAYNSSGNRSSASIEHQEGTTSKVARTKSETPPDMGNPLILPGSNHNSITNPGSGSEHSPGFEVRNLLSLLDRKTPSFVPSLSEIYSADINNADTDTVFPDAQAAHHHDDGRDLSDNTLPRSINQQRAIVKALVEAMKSTEHARDNPNMIKPFEDGKYSDTRIEKVCWSIMQTCMYRHSRGFLLAPFEMKPKQAHELTTYAERLAKIIELLTIQKTICKHLLDPYYLFQFVDDPIGAHKRVLANMSLNRRKGRFMTAGKEAMSKSSPIDSPQAGHEDVIADTPSSVGHVRNGMTRSSNLDDPDRTLTPDAMRVRNLNSSITSSSPAAGRISGIGSGATPHRLSSRLAMPAPTSPSPAPKTKGACMDHIKRLHGRRMSITSYPQGEPAGGATPGPSRNASFEDDAASRENAQAVGIDDSQNTEGTEDTSTRQLRSTSVASSTSSGHKRGASELDEAVSPKKQRR